MNLYHVTLLGALLMCGCSAETTSASKQKLTQLGDAVKDSKEHFINLGSAMEESASETKEALTTVGDTTVSAASKTKTGLESVGNAVKSLGIGTPAEQSAAPATPSNVKVFTPPPEQSKP